MTTGAWARCWEPAQIADAHMPHPDNVLKDLWTKDDSDLLVGTYKTILDYLTGQECLPALFRVATFGWHTLI